MRLLDAYVVVEFKAFPTVSAAYIFEHFIPFPQQPRALKIHASHHGEFWIKASLTCQVANDT